MTRRQAPLTLLIIVGAYLALLTGVLWLVGWLPFIAAALSRLSGLEWRR